tara:strand:- start:3241 stop:4572 length:1332 start_codon:yes stop_codon:yes gene_type:complete
LTSKSRFAPSPTGLIHIGNARSAALNWAYIINKGGKFILRIDDTDDQRNNKKYEDIIKKDLNWLGVNWSKTFNQSSRKELYQKKIEFLKNQKRIYPCFETQEELSLKRKTLLASGQPPIYDRSALKLSEEQINKNIVSGKKPHWRFKLEDKIVEWEDLIKNKITFDCNKLSDPIVIREDDSLLYHLPSVIDDINEEITDVIRGEDHITNTAFHIQMFEALEAKIPSFGHHPFLIDEHGKNLSKRLGSLSINALKDEGFENITILNYLLRVGTSKNLLIEKNIESLIKKFNIKDIGTASPKFSKKNLEIINKNILQSYNYIDVKLKFKKLNYNNVSEDFWLFVKNNIDYFKDFIKWLEIINSNNKFTITDEPLLQVAARLLPEEPYSISTWENWTKKISKETGKTGKKLYMPLRLALTGQDKGPELKFLLPLLKKEHILKKLSS